MRKLRSVGSKLGLLTSVVLLAVFVVAAQWVGYFMHSNVGHVMLHQAQSLYNQVTLARHWNASYGGVYVRKLPGVETNPFLYQVGPGGGRPSNVIPEIQDKHGNVYTLKNPATMGRELSELAEKYSDVRFRLTSLLPVNPANAPDDFEQRSLKQFADGAREASEFGQINGKQYFRYMAPVYVEEPCLQCHGFQGYKTGEVRGGISVSLPMENEVLEFMESKSHFILFASLILVLVVVTIITSSYFIIMRPLRAMTIYAGNLGGRQSLPAQMASRHDEVGLLAKELNSANAALHEQRLQIRQQTLQMEHENRTDALTNLYNRRHLFSEGARLYDRWKYEGVEVAILLIAINHLKHINDTHGHEAGDHVLAEVAHILRQHCRPYDLIARYGGEEFIILLEVSDHENGESIANRINQSIGGQVTKYKEKEIEVTINISVVQGRDLGDFDAALRKADETLDCSRGAGQNGIAIYDK